MNFFYRKLSLMKVTLVFGIFIFCFLCAIYHVTSYDEAIVYRDMYMEENEIVTAKISVELNGIVSYYDTLTEALEVVPEEQETIITLLGDLELNAAIVIPSNKKIVIDGGTKYSIIRGKNTDETWYTGTLINVEADAELILKSLIVDGANEWALDMEKYQSLEDKTTTFNANDITTYPIISSSDGPVASADMIVNAGVLTVKDTIIKNHYGIFFNSNGSRSGKHVIAFKNNAKLVMDNSTIMHCAANDAGAILRTWGEKNVSMELINNSLITDSFGITNGGIVSVMGTNITLDMTNSSISSNCTLSGGGAAVMVYGNGSVFTMNEGSKITNNYGPTTAGVVYSRNNGTFIMNGGEISGNTGSSIGGVYNTSTLQLNSGILGDNNVVQLTYEFRDAVYSSKDLTIGENMVINDNIFVVGNLTNNGTINGNVAISVASAEESVELNGSGSINGDLFLFYTGEEVPVITSNTTVSGEVLPVNMDTQALVIYEYNGGQNSDGSTIVTAIAAEVGSVLILPSVTREGHTFTGWYVDKELTTLYDASVHGIVGPQMNLYAGWRINKYTITWKIDDLVESKVLTYGDTLVMPEVPEKKGYVFEEWSNYKDGMTVPAKDITFVAKYTVKNPGTGDNILFFVAIGVVSVISLILVIVYYVKRDKNRKNKK